MPIPADVYKKIVDAKVFIDEHFDSPIDLDAIAGEACLSRFHFHRLFRRISDLEIAVLAPLTPGAMGYDDETRKAFKVL